MKKIALLTILVAILLITIPVAAGPKEPVGDPVGWEVTTYPVGLPFHIVHGWLFGAPPLETNVGAYSFELEFDGEIIKPSFKIIGYDPSTETYRKLYFYNFPDGMTGEHEFVGHYYATCSEEYDDCKNPARGVEVYTHSQIITFTE